LFDVHVTVHRDWFLIIKPTRCTNLSRPKSTKGCSADWRRRRCTNFSNLFWKETLHVSNSSSVDHREFFTVHAAVVYVKQLCCQKTCLTYTTAACKCTVKNSWWWTEELSETCRVSFQNKFEKLVLLLLQSALQPLVGFGLLNT